VLDADTVFVRGGIDSVRAYPPLETIGKSGQTQHSILFGAVWQCG
jgi:hypothetical protein